MTGGEVEREQRALQELLRELRLEAGLRQVDVAKAMNFPQSMVSKYEAGERRLDIPEVRALCEMFGLTLSQFVEKLDNRLRE